VTLNRRGTTYSSTVPGGRDQQAELSARAKEATERAKRKWRVGDLLADERCSPAVLDLLRGTYVGRAAPPVEETWDSEGTRPDLYSYRVCRRTGVAST